MPRSERRKAPEGGSSDGGDNFAVMFTSLNLILLSFFILLNSISIKDSERKRKALGSVRGSFGILEGGENPTQEGKVLVKSDEIATSSSHRPALLSETQRILRQAGLMRVGTDVAMVHTADGLRIEFSDRVLFTPGRAELNPELFKTLDDIASMMVRIDRQLIVRGYASPERPRRYPSNLELSTSRATRVARYLATAAKMPPRLVVAEGRGVRRDGAKFQRFVELVVPGKSLQRKLRQLEVGR